MLIISIGQIFANAKPQKQNKNKIKFINLITQKATRLKNVNHFRYATTCYLEFH